ncbi:hypothetical protein JOL79_06980 [Microbispora sp. RL4-1S]|uniref:Uncharacterized protein n=1 Tax=Microbispora oryzae TaxID=2806554 RepID=A0A941AI80_9ACTN|nr:hypothetical protein [Microbispora oryzae]MBP2703542.1 hypothetical protein [Microbispora oryzae]
MEKTFYLRFDDGSVGIATYTLPAGSTEISQAEYEADLARIETENEATREAQQQAELQSLADSLAELMAGGMTEATARRVLNIPPDLELPAPQTGEPATA